MNKFPKTPKSTEEQMLGLLNGRPEVSELFFNEAGEYSLHKSAEFSTRKTREEITGSSLSETGETEKQTTKQKKNKK
jgi:hypothetical protein